jgi:hypothetical protein
MLGDTCFSASYVVARSSSKDCAATSSPSGPNCGSQKRLRFGSFPITKFLIEGNRFAIAAV